MHDSTSAKTGKPAANEEWGSWSYGIIPEPWLDHFHKLATAEFAVLMVLAAHTTKTKSRVYPAVARLMMLTNLSRSTIYRATQGLEQKGFFRLEHDRGPHASPTYTLTVPPSLGAVDDDSARKAEHAFRVQAEKDRKRKERSRRRSEVSTAAHRRATAGPLPSNSEVATAAHPVAPMTDRGVNSDRQGCQQRPPEEYKEETSEEDQEEDNVKRVAFSEVASLPPATPSPTQIEDGIDRSGGRRSIDPDRLRRAMETYAAEIEMLAVVAEGEVVEHRRADDADSAGAW